MGECVIRSHVMKHVVWLRAPRLNPLRPPGEPPNPRGVQRKSAMTTVAATPLIDTRLLCRPKTYTGGRDRWAQRELVFKAYIGAVDQSLLASLDIAEQQVQGLDFDTFGANPLQHARVMSYILSQVVTGGRCRS